MSTRQTHFENIHKVPAMDLYVSNVSIIFYCSMLYYLLFWAILGFIIHFYIIFGTNLLTGGPAQICCFFPISVFRRKGISNGVETERNQLEKLFLEGKLVGERCRKLKFFLRFHQDPSMSSSKQRVMGERLHLHTTL